MQSEPTAPVPPTAEISSLPATTIPPAAAQRPAPRSVAPPRPPGVWAVAAAAFAAVFAAVYFGLTSGNATPKGPERKSDTASAVQQPGQNDDAASHSPLSAEAIFAAASPAVVRVE